jgi:hypothetical protein
MSAAYSRRLWIGLVLIALFVGVSQLQALRSAFAAYRTLGRPDEVSRHEARLQALRRALPGHGVVGYVSDAPAAGIDPASSEARQAFKRYLLTQYALAPLVVLRSIEAELVVGDFSAAGPDGASTPPGFVLVKDFGQGVVLFRRPSG